MTTNKTNMILILCTTSTRYITEAKIKNNNPQPMLGKINVSDEYRLPSNAVTICSPSPIALSKLDSNNGIYAIYGSSDDVL